MNSHCFLPRSSSSLAVWLALAATGSAQITGPADVDPNINATYQFYDSLCDFNQPVNWTVAGAATIVTQSATTCTIKPNNLYPTNCGISLAVNYSLANGHPDSASLSIGRYAFMTGPTTVYAGQSYTYTACDPCHNPFFTGYSWSATQGEANASAVISWHYNGVTVQWPAAVPSSALATGIIGRVRCTVSGSGYSAMTADYPVKVTLPGTGITGPHALHLHMPVTYHAYAMPGTPTNCGYQWTLPPGWTGASTTNTIVVRPNILGSATLKVRQYMSSAVFSSDSTMGVLVVPMPDIKIISKKVEAPVD